MPQVIVPTAIIRSLVQTAPDVASGAPESCAHAPASERSPACWDAAPSWDCASLPCSAIGHASRTPQPTCLENGENLTRQCQFSFTENSKFKMIFPHKSECTDETVFQGLLDLSSVFLIFLSFLSSLLSFHTACWDKPSRSLCSAV